MSSRYKEETYKIFKYDGREPIRLLEWRVKKDAIVAKGCILFAYDENGIEKRYKCPFFGTILDLYAQDDREINPGDELLLYEVCLHPTVMKDLCAECGEDLRQYDNIATKPVKKAVASVSMIHSVPELRVSQEHAEKLGKADLKRLTDLKKLVLLVDLDQTLIHTTYENVQDIKGVIHYQLYGSNTPWYHTKLRPHTEEFLTKVSELFELHICTFGARLYAHKIASLLDPSGKLFSHRILSRDECFDPNSKTGNLKALFPCGDSMVCIIDDREDVWNFSPNVVAVKPYVFFKNTGDINCPYKSRTEVLPMIQNKRDAPAISEAPSTECKSTAEDATSIVKDTQAIVAASTDVKLNETTAIENEANEAAAVDDEGNVTADKSKTNCENSIVAATDGESCRTVPVNDEAVMAKPDDGLQSGHNPAGNTNNREDDEDDYLLYLEDILRRIHKEYYTMYETYSKSEISVDEKQPDLKEIIPRLKKEVLKSVNVAFSGVVPTNIAVEKSKLWNLALSLGANVQKEIITEAGCDKTTHLVAAKYGTLKVNKALKHNIKVVNPLWLICCFERWEHAEESIFPLNKGDDFTEQPKRRIQPVEANFVTLKPSTSSTQNSGHTPMVVYPVYDPITGKRVNTSKDIDSQPSYSGTENQQNDGKCDPEPHNMVEFSPLSAFSKSDLQMMDKEVDDACSEGDEMSTGNTESSADEEEPLVKGNKRKYEESSSDESLTNECPKGWSKGRARADEDETRESFNEGAKSDSSDDFNESVGSVDEEMAAAVEREFLS